MSDVIAVSLATACILTAIEGLLIPLGKWRGLLALVTGLGFLLILGETWPKIFIDTFAVTFVGLTLSLIVEQVFSSPESRRLPRRVESRNLPK